MAKIDIDKFICSLMQFTPVSKEVKYLINCALKDQGLEYKDCAIVEIEPKQRPLIETEYDPYSLPVGDDSNLPRFDESKYHPFYTKKDVEECAKMPEGYIENLRELCKNILKVTEKKEEKQ